MTYWYTPRVERVAVRAILLVNALVFGISFWLTRDLGHSVLYALLPNVPFTFLSYWFRDHAPPRIGEKRYEEVHYWKAILWDGEKWVEAEQAAK